MPLDYPDFQDAISDLKTIQQALRQYPILADGGEEEVVLRPGQRLTPDQIRDSITNELIHLETGRARVRLKQPPPNLQSLVCHRCGKVHSITGTAKEYNGPIRYSPSTCSGCKIPLRTEYLIEIQRPQGNYAPLEPRVKRIVANNRRQGYLRIRDDIQKDIDDRQQASTLLHPAPEPISKTPTTQPSSPPPIKRQNKIV